MTARNPAAAALYIVPGVGRVADSFQPAVAVPHVRLEAGALHPAVPGVDEDQPLIAEPGALHGDTGVLEPPHERVYDGTDHRRDPMVTSDFTTAINAYTQQVERSRQMFLAILGHDLRSPVSAIFTSTRYMLETAEQTAQPFIIHVAEHYGRAPGTSCRGSSCSRP